MRRKIKAQTVLIHSSMWMVYVVLEYLANIYHIRDGTELEFMRSVMLTLPLIMIPTYFMVWVVVPRFLKSGKILASLISFFLVLIYVFYGRVLWMDIMNDLHFTMFKHIPVAKIFKNVIRDYSVIALAVCIYLLADWRKKEKLNLELITAKAEVELQLLKGQLHPHFLFNSLNNIYSLALIRSDLTADAILKLTDLLDYLVYKANSRSVPLSKEVQLINTYLDLESLRYSDILVVERNMDVKNLDIPIAPLVLLPFVENCFKHGGAGSDGIFKIIIEIAFKNNVLSFKIVNTITSVVGQIPNTQGEGGNATDRSVGANRRFVHTDSIHGGLGLDNIRKRLQLLYPGKHRLEIESRINQYSVSLTISYEDEI